MAKKKTPPPRGYYTIDKKTMDILRGERERIGAPISQLVKRAVEKCYGKGESGGKSEG